MYEREVYGYELILDLHGCDVDKFTRKSFRKYFIALCDEIEMERAKLVFWDDRWVIILNKILPWRWIWPVKVQTNPKTTGISVVQFILTSSVVIHALTKLGNAYVNIFSCKEFDEDKARELTKKWFGTKQCNAHFIKRM